MRDIFDMLEYVLRVMIASLLTLFGMLFAVIITLCTACGQGLTWLVKKLVDKYDDEDKKVEDMVTEE